MSVRPRPRRLSLRAYVDGILAGNRTVLAQAITVVESSHPGDIDLAEQILEECLPHTGASTRVGITGVPGVGKSSLIEALGTFLTRERGEKVAVLAVDPSSRLSGGSILGDKTRMESLAVDELAFIRPSPSRGSLGGVARRTRETMLLCEASGYSNIIVETVGVGQSEVAVRSMVDFFLLLMLTGAGDELQGMKRGVMEMADLVAVNKADGDNARRARSASREIASALHLFPAQPSGWIPQAVTCSARTREGIRELWESVLAHAAALKANGWFERVRQAQLKQWTQEIIEHSLLEQFQSHRVVRERLPELEAEVSAGRISSFRAARAILEAYKTK